LESEDERIVVWLVAVDGVLRQRTLSPGIHSSHTMDVEVDVEVDELSSGEFMRMLHIEIFLAVVPCPYAERLATVNTEGMFAGGK
jgi:hypothetical protein